MGRLMEDEQKDSAFYGLSYISMFERQAVEKPDSTAIVCRGSSTSYEVLNRKVNQAARWMNPSGGRVGRVGIHVHRSIDLVISVLAVLKLGGSCVPLDPLDPVERKRLILENAEVDLLLTEGAFEGEACLGNIGRHVSIEKERCEIRRQSGENTSASVREEGEAIIIYTSGTSGRPKGVVLSHGNLRHYVLSLASSLELNPSDVYLFRGSIALVVSLRHLLMPLAWGATVAMADERQVRDPFALFEFIRNTGATIVDHAPSFWRGCAHAFAAGSPEMLEGIFDCDGKFDNQLRLVGTGGESVSRETIEWFFSRFRSGIRFVNLYGQTEGSGVVSVGELNPSSALPGHLVSVGEPIEGMCLYLLNQQHEPVGIGEEGEIAISGHGVARGYFGDAVLTSRRFITIPFKGKNDPNPSRSDFDAGAHETLYLTGDRGRLNENHEIEFIGRTDRQVNIRGYRVELGEIEHTLSQHPRVGRAAVIARTDETGRCWLVAYFESADTASGEACGGECQSRVLRAFLEDRIPGYMVPSQYVPMTALPTSGSHKVIYADLPDPGPLDRARAGELNIPMTALQVRLSEIWQRVLSIESFSMEDTFGELGGDSLRAVSVLVEIQRELGVTFSLDLEAFAGLSIEGLAERIEQFQNESSPQLITKVQEGDGRNPLFVVHAVNGLNWFARLFAQRLKPSQTVYALQWHAPERVGVSIDSLESYAARLVDTIMAAEPEGPYRLLGVSFGAQLAFQMAIELVQRGHEPQFLGLIDENTDSHLRCFGRRRAKPETRRIDHQCVHWLRCYVPRVYPGSLVLFQTSSRDSDVLADSYAGWREVTLEGVERVRIPGSHFDLIGRSNLDQWANQLQGSVERAQLDWERHNGEPGRVEGLKQRIRIHLKGTAVRARISACEKGKDGDLEGEIRLYEESIAANPDQPYWVYRNLGCACWDSGRIDRALESLSLAARREEVPIIGYGLYAGHLKTANRESDYRVVMDLLRKRELRSAEACYGLGMVMLDQGCYEEAEVAFDKAIEFEADHLYTLFGKAKLACLRGRLDEALERVERLVARHPNEMMFLGLKARVLADQGAYDPAVSITRRLIVVAPNDLWLRWTLVRLLVLSGEQGDAARALTLLASRLPSSMDGSEFLRSGWQRFMGSTVSRLLSRGLMARGQLHLIAFFLGRLPVAPLMLRIWLWKRGRA